VTPVLRVEGLCKEYPTFRLDNVTFEVEKGSIMGFIGRNGAGKTTTLKSILNLVHPLSGSVKFFGLDMANHEAEIKQRIGYAVGTVSFYKRKRISTVAAVTGTFFDKWDDSAFRRYTDMFAIDTSKTPDQLSEGMKVKLNLALALSHGAELLILDEPTSGLDPVSRDELLELFLRLAGEGVSILFSTHITSDLEKCADHITYIKNGHIAASRGTKDFETAYLLVRGYDNSEAIIGETLSKDGKTGLIFACDRDKFTGCDFSAPTLEEIMVHLEKEGRK
jgi:ABC-2 type transport system ATP-binding protein